MLRFPFSCLETAKWLQQLSHTHVCTGGCSGSHPPPTPKWVLGAPRCPPDPKLDASSFGKRQTTGVSPREKFGKTSFLGASSAPPPMKMSPLAFACVNPDGFLVSSPADTLSVPRWSPQIPRRDLGNSIKHRYAGPGVGWERAMGTPEPSLASPRAPGDTQQPQQSAWDAMSISFSSSCPGRGLCVGFPVCHAWLHCPGSPFKFHFSSDLG